MLNRKMNFIVLMILLLISVKTNAQWKLQNIKNNFGDIRSVYFSDSLNGIGVAGKIVKTTDGGRTWTMKDIDNCSSYNTINAVTKRILWITGYYVKAMKSTDAGETWEYYPKDQPIIFREVSFIDSLNGYAFDYSDGEPRQSAIYKTTNGGLNWVENQNFPKGLYAFKINYTSITTVFVSGSNFIYKTQDDGKTWQSVLHDTLFNSFTFDASCFLSDSIGFYSGHYTTKENSNWNDVTINTTDCGKTWKVCNQNYNYAIAFADKKNGFACGYSGSIIKTTDCGETWFSINPQVSVSMPSLAVLDANSVIVIGTGESYAKNMILKTNNNGATWERLDSGRLTYFNTLKFINKNIGYGAGDNGEIDKTTDGGKNWIKQSPGKYSGRIWSGYFLDSLTGWYIMWNDYGNESTIIRTTNGGNSWDSLFAIPYQIYSAHFLNKSNGFVCGSGGRIFKTTNGGKTWKLIATSFTSYNFIKITFTDEKHGWATADKWTIAKTTDGGDSWITCHFDWGKFNDVVFIDSLNGWATGVCGLIEFPFIRTTNGGVNWSSFKMELPAQMYGLSFPSNKTGYAIGGSGVICKTTDSGATWRRLSFPENRAFNDICFVDENNGWVVTDNGLIYYTSNGGEEPTSFTDDNKNGLPKDFRLSQNYPNPFNPSTKIKYSIPKEEKVLLTVYNLLGQKISELVNETKPAGNYEVVFDGKNLSSGVYLYRLQCGNFINTKKIILLK